MASSNTIQPSNSITIPLPSADDPRFAFISKFREERLGNLRPVSEFVDRNRLSKPNGFQDVARRWSYNLRYFQSNYFLIILALLVYVLITNAWLLLTVVFIMLALRFISSLGDEPLAIGGSVVTSKQLYAALIGASIVLLWISSAGSAVFWVIGAAAFVVLGHAAILEPGVEGDFASGAVQV
ncbi:hypothetical protein BZG36_00969 [Bifiguratus adelaidae]|uniref:PRA1 family protein n=1 Tax=Bifiguratus adelaidae TaxID=1938954 RepID=A0A261Y694_9FUNG|nr:hypothetical protein BZG36_00969 [Bifiguratus adelaidae]